MSGAIKKGGKRMSSANKLNMSFGDVTINDYANSSHSSGKSRIKKATANIAVREVKQLTIEADDRAWFDKLEDYEGDFEFVQEGEEDSEVRIVKRTPRRRKKTLSESNLEDEQRGGIDYPLDIWFLISEHIAPEDVATFACICKSTLHVVHTGKFWFHLYRRYYSSVPNLPEPLQPECMVRLYGLKASVVRTLYYTYPLFVNRLVAHTTFEADPHALTKRQCVLMWYKKTKNQWLYFFKLKHNSLVPGRGVSLKAKQPDLIEMLEDVTANQEEGCKVLQVTCLNYIPVPVVMGLTLCSVSLTLSQGFRHHRLQLSFGSSLACHTAGKCPATVDNIVVLDPVLNVRVLDWWHPLYPYNSGTGFNFHVEDSE